MQNVVLDPDKKYIPVIIQFFSANLFRLDYIRRPSRNMLLLFETLFDTPQQQAMLGLIWPEMVPSRHNPAEASISPPALPLQRETRLIDKNKPAAHAAGTDH